VFNTRDALSQAYALRDIWVIGASLEALQSPTLQWRSEIWPVCCYL